MTPDEDLLRDLQALRARTADPAPDFMARVLADALAAQPRAASPDTATAVAAPEPVRDGFWRALSKVLGGGPAFAGLAAAGVLGGVLGYADPSVLSGDWLTGAGDGLELAPAAEIFLGEG